MRKIFTLILSIMLILLFLSACGGQSEGNAKKTVNNYLSLMKKGDTYEASKLLDGNDSLIDVFNYKYLDTIREEDIEKEISVSRVDFENMKSNGYESGTWEEYKEKMSNLYTCDKCDVELYDGSIRITDGSRTHKRYTLLYDTEIANGLGNKLYKKVEFKVEWDDVYDEFKIDSIKVR